MNQGFDWFSEAIYTVPADINLIMGSHWLVYTDQSEGGADQPVL